MEDGAAWSAELDTITKRAAYVLQFNKNASGILFDLAKKSDIPRFRGALGRLLNLYEIFKIVDPAQAAPADSLVNRFYSELVLGVLDSFISEPDIRALLPSHRRAHGALAWTTWGAILTNHADTSNMNLATVARSLFTMAMSDYVSVDAFITGFQFFA